METHDGSAPATPAAASSARAREMSAASSQSPNATIRGAETAPPHTSRIFASEAAESSERAFRADILPSKTTPSANGSAAAVKTDAANKNARGRRICGSTSFSENFSRKVGRNPPLEMPTANAGSASTEIAADAATPANPKIPSCAIPPPRHATAANASRVVAQMTETGLKSAPAVLAAKSIPNFPRKSSGYNMCMA